MISSTVPVDGKDELKTSTRTGLGYNSQLTSFTPLSQSRRQQFQAATPLVKSYQTPLQSVPHWRTSDLPCPSYLVAWPHTAGHRCILALSRQHLLESCQHWLYSLTPTDQSAQYRFKPITCQLRSLTHWLDSLTTWLKPGSSAFHSDCTPLQSATPKHQSEYQYLAALAETSELETLAT